MDYRLLRRECTAHFADQKRGVRSDFLETIDDGFRSKQFKPGDFSIRQLFLATVPGGQEILESWAPNSPHISLAEADHISLMESGATLSSAFSHITGQIVYNAVLEAYTDEAFAITPLVSTISTQFNGERIPGVTRLGDTFESIGENQPYPLAGLGEDWIDTPQTVKRGEIVPLSREAIFFDRTGLILARAAEGGTFYGMNKEKRLIDAVIDENVTAHRYKWKDTVYASYAASGGHGAVNLKGSNGLVDWTNIDAAELLMSKIIDPHTGEPILITPKHLLVARQLKPTARQIITATQVRKGDGASNTSVTIGMSPIDTNYQIVSSALLAQRLATDTDWFIGDIGKNVKYMENWPMQVTEAPANSEAEFTHDIIRRWKISERGAAVVVQPRAMVKSTVGA